MIAASAIAPPVARSPSLIGILGRFNAVRTLYRRAEDHAGSGEQQRNEQSERPHTETLTAAIKA